jgi:hypothetical protein
MIRTVFTLSLIAILSMLAAAQDAGIHGPTTASAASAQGAEAGSRSSNYPPFCPPQDCLYYAGDFDSSYSGANSLFNDNYEDGTSMGQAWVGVKPDYDATVTGATFVELVGDGSFQLDNPTPFAIQVGIKPGQAGKTVCSTKGTATAKVYGNSGDVLSYAITIEKMSSPCKLRKGKLYYVNLLPTTHEGFGYLWNVPPMPQNHRGWSNDRNHCYYNSPQSNYNYADCNELGDFSELSIALTGKQ